MRNFSYGYKQLNWYIVIMSWDIIWKYWRIVCDVYDVMKSWRIVCDINKNFSAMVTKPFQLWLQNFGYKQLGNIVVNHEILFAILMYCLWCCFIFMTKYHVYIPKCQVNVSHLATWHCFFPQCLEIGISNFKITRLYTRPAGQVGGIKTVYKERFNYSRGHNWRELNRSYIRRTE